MGLMGYCECGEEAIVAIGHDKVPVCLVHFEDYLREASRLLIGKGERPEFPHKDNPSAQACWDGHEEGDTP